MGNTESSTNIVSVNNQLTMNQNDFNSKVEQLNKTISNTNVSVAQSCTSAANNNQAVVFDGLTSGGDIEIGVDQNLEAFITFSCVNANTVKQKAGSDIITGITDAVANSADNQIIQALESAAKTQSDSGWGAIGNFQQHSNVQQFSNTDTRNTNVVNLNKLIQNVVESNFNADIVSNCNQQTMNRQDVVVRDAAAKGNIKAAIKQSMATRVMSECIQKSGVGTEIMNVAATALGVKIDSANKNTASQESKAAAETKGKTEGAGDAAAKTLGGLAGLVDSVGGAVGSIFGGILSGPLMIIGAIVLCCLLCCASSFLLPKLMGGSTPPPQPGAIPGTEMATSDMNGEMGPDMGGEMGQGMGADMGPAVGTSV